MKIITTEQAVLELILAHWNDPILMDYKTTLTKIREHWPVTERSMALDWEFTLTKASLIDLSKKYLGKDLQMNNEPHILLVDSTNLSLKILSWEESLLDFPKRMNRIYVGL